MVLCDGAWHGLAKAFAFNAGSKGEAPPLADLPTLPCCFELLSLFGYAMHLKAWRPSLLNISWVCLQCEMLF